ncbi:unnamed protein product, partial [Symbiodinium necroappetens]
NQLSIDEGEGTRDGSSDSMCIIDDDEESTGASKDVASAAAAQVPVDPMEIVDSDTELSPQEDSPAPLSKVPLVSAETQEASSDPPVGEQTFANPQLIQLMCIDSDDEEAQAAPLPKWPGEAAVVAPNPQPFRRCDTSASSLPVPEDRDKDDGSASYVGGSTDSLEKSMAAVGLTSPEATQLQGFTQIVNGCESCTAVVVQIGMLQVLDVAPKDVAPVPKVSKYPEICPPQPEFLESMDKCIAEAEPPLYNSTGLAGGKNKRRRRGKQADEPASKKSKAADHEEDDGGDDDNHDDDGEPVPEDEAMEEPITEPVKARAKKPKLLEKVADRKKAPVEPKVTDAVCEKAAQKAVEPAVSEPAAVDAKAQAHKKAKPVKTKKPEKAEPVETKKPEKAEPVETKKPKKPKKAEPVDAKVKSAAAEAGKGDGTSADDLPSREELTKMGA